MTTYQRTETVEAMQWDEFQSRTRLPDLAREIVAWVNANGGDASYVTERQAHSSASGYVKGPCIAVRTSTGWSHAQLGDWIVMGDEPKRQDCPHRFYPGSDCTCARSFIVVRAADWASAGWQPADTAVNR